MPSDSTETTGSETLSWQEILALIAGGFTVFVDGIGELTGGTPDGSYTTQGGGAGSTDPGRNYTVTAPPEPYTLEWVNANPAMALLIAFILWRLLS